jgi:hypothetical protein
VDFVAQIDTPMLDSLQTTFFSDVIPNISQFHKFIDRTDRLKTFIQAEVYLRPWEVQAIFKSHANIGLDIACEVLDSPASSMMRLFEQLLPIPSGVEQLKLYGEEWDELIEFLMEHEFQDDPADPLWVQLLNSFVSVKSLFVSERLVPLVAFVLEKLTGESVTEVLPALDNLFLEGFGPTKYVEETIKSFVSRRQFSGHPVILQRWERKSSFGSSSGGLQFCSCGHLVILSDCSPRQFE